MNVLLTTSAAPDQTPFSTNEKRPPVGLGYLISVLREAGHRVFFIDNYLAPSNFLETDYLQKNQIDFVGIYTNTICFRDSLRMFYRLEDLRQEGIWKGKIIAGGPHASVSPETIPSFVDHIVVGEGEFAILDIVAGKVKERIIQYPTIENLDELPMPAWDCFAEMPYNWGGNWLPEAPVFTMNTSRGCPFDCTFCSVGSIWGRRYTYFSAERVVADIEHVVKHHGAKGIYFREDNFTLNKKRLYEFCALMIDKGVNIPWVCETRASSLDRETVELMARAGARGAYIGVESGSQRLLDFMQKGIKLEDIHHAFRLCQEFGINTAASVIVGVPTETEHELQMTIELLDEIRPTVTWFNAFVGIPKSKLYMYVLENKLYEYIDDRGLVYLKGHNERVSKWYGKSWDAELPIQLQNNTIVNPRVSVVMSVYNGAKYLLEAIRSIQSQTFNNFEFIIVNDASNDTTAEILQQIDDPRVRVLTNEQNFGLTKSLNKALKHCRGEFIARMDADDLSHPFRLEKQVSFLESRPECALVGSSYYVIDEDGKNVSHIGVLTESSQIKDGLKNQNWFGHGSVMMRKSALNKVGGYDEEFRYAQDYDLWLRLSEHYNVANIKEPLYFWRSTAEAISRDKVREQKVFAELAKKYALTREHLSGESSGRKIMQDFPVVSVIVPTHNRPDMLKNAIQSILDQTFQDLEIIVVNDAGQDVSVVVAAFNSPKITYLSHESNKGLAATRNTGIRAVKGKYVAYLDDDDIFCPDHLKTLVDFLQKTGEKVAYTDAFRAHQRLEDGRYVTYKRDTQYSYDFDYDRILYENYIPVLCFMHEKGCFDVCGMFDETFSCLEDWELWLRMSRYFTMHHIKALTCEYSYRPDGTNMVSSSDYKFMYMTERLYNKHSIDGRKDIAEIRNSHLNSMLRSCINENVKCAVVQLFYSDGKGASESCAMVRHIPVDNELQDIIFDLSNIRTKTNIRLDPHCDSVILSLESIIISGIDGLTYEISTNDVDSNAELVINNTYYFATKDPFFNINGIPAHILNNAQSLTLRVKYLKLNTDALNTTLYYINLNKKLNMDVINNRTSRIICNTSLSSHKSGITETNHNIAVNSKVRTYDVIIPIYNAYDYTLNCIQHVIKYTDPLHPVYLLDDASTDPRMKPMLQEFASKYDHVKFIESSQNHGFIQNMNRGFALSRNDVVILNSDTQVTKGWLDRMDHCLVLHPNTAVVSPLSNNATILSVPLMNSNNVLPPEHTTDTVAAIVATLSSRIYPMIPTAVGFCMIMTRKSLDMLGGFDTIYGKGYGEECDYCMRVWAAGMEVRCCDDAYVQHYGEASFCAVSQISEQRIINRNNLKKRWPDYEKKVFAYCLKNPLLDLQEKIYHALYTKTEEKRPHVLHVIHSIFAKGGTELHTLNVISRISENFRSTVFLPHTTASWVDVEAGQVKEFVRVAFLNDQIVQSNEYFCGYPNELLNDLVEHKFAQFLSGGDYNIVHFQHLIKWNSFLLPFIAKALGKKVVISLHDYFLLCPEYNLILPSNTKCDKPYALEYDESCFTCLGEKRYVEDPANAVQLHEYLAERHAIVGLMLKEADVIVAPSDFVKKQFIRAFDKSLEEKIRVIPHGVSVSAQISRPKRGDNLRVAFLGNLTYQKGAECLLDAAELLKNRNVSFHVFGGIADKALAEKVRQSNIDLHGSYQVEDLPTLLAQIDIVLIPSVWHETFCLTLSEAQALGVPVIAADVGALSERIIDGETGFLFRVADAAHLSERLNEIAQKRNSLDHVIKTLCKLRIKTIQENVEDYANLYSELCRTSSDNCILDDREGLKQKTYSTAVSNDSELAKETALRNRLVDESCTKAQTQFQSGDIDGAVKALINQGIKANPTSPHPYLELSEVLIAAGRYEDALQVLPEMPLATDSLLKSEIEAICHVALGNDAAALKAAIQAQKRPRAQVVLGTLAARQGDLAEAEAFFRRAIEADPSCSGGWLSLGMLLWSQGKQEDAWLVVKRSVIADPLNDEAVRILQDMALRHSLQYDVLQIITDAVRQYPDSRNLKLHQVELLACCGKETETLDACENFLVKFGVDEVVLGKALQLRHQIGVYNRLVGSEDYSITLCMIVKNEDKNLSACLASLKPVVHEMVVVDTGSSDLTADIATAFGARVCTFDWEGDFSNARNYSLAQANGAWILVMDADEVLSVKDYEAVRRSVREAVGKRNAWSVLTRNYTTRVNAQGWTPNDHVYPVEERADGWQPSWKVRLFPNNRRIQYRGEVHEMVEQDLRQSGYTISPASFVVHHYGELYRSPEELTNKQRRYFDLGKQKLAQRPNDVAALTELAVQAGELGLYDEALGLWDRVLALQPDMVEALFNKSYVFICLKRYREGLDASMRALENDPDHKEAAFNYGTCALLTADPCAAITVVAPVLEKHQDYPLLLALMTVLYLVTGRHDQARTAYAELVSMDYAIADYIRDRAIDLVMAGRHDMARELRKGALWLGIDASVPSERQMSQ